MLVIARPLHGIIRAPACSLTVVGFDSFRGEADGGDGARLGGVAVARGDQSSGVRRHRFRPRIRRRVRCRRRGWRKRPTATTDLLQPSLQGNPVTPPRFQQLGQAAPPGIRRRRPTLLLRLRASVRRPTTGVPRASAKATPATTSMNTPKSKRKKRAAQRAAAGSQSTTTFAPVPNYVLPPPLPPPLPLQTPLPEVYPKNAARRPGAIIGPPPEDCRSTIRRLKCIPCRRQIGPAPR